MNMSTAAQSSVKPETPLPDCAGAYLVFEFTGKRYGVKAAMLKESIRLPELTPVDDEPDYIVGVLNLRGRVLPVMDLNLRMGRRTQPYTINHCVVVLNNQGRLLGLMANDLVKLTDYLDSDVDPLQHFEEKDTPAARRLLHCVRGVAKDSEELVAVLDTDILFSSAWPEDKNIKEDLPGPLTEPGSFCPEASDADRAVFLNRRQRLMQHTEAMDTSELASMAVIRIGQAFLGIDLGIVRGFAGTRKITPVPCCPAYILGNINLRGEVLTVVDLRGFLQLPPADPSAYLQILVAKSGDITVAVSIDEIQDVISLGHETTAQTPVAGGALTGDFVKGAVIYKKKMISIIDLDHILTSGMLVVNQEKTI